MSYKLIYFPARGRGQATRYICLDHDITLEEQVVTKDEWPAMKPNVIFGQLPVLCDGNFEVAQSNTILRHLARKLGLYGKDETEATKIDMINDTQEDARHAYVRFIYDRYDTDKENYIKSLPEKLALFERVLGKNNGGAGFFVGEKISFVDYTMFDLLDNYTVLSPTVLNTFPLLKSFHDRMASRQKLAKYRQTEAFKSLPINGNGKQ